MIMILVDILTAYSICTRANSESWKKNDYPTAAYCYMALSILGVLFIQLLVVSVRLYTNIDVNGISYQFYPFQLKYRNIFWEDLSQCYVRKYNPICEYGGWGFKAWISGQAVNIKGNDGLQLVHKDGKKLLIGTSKPDELKSALISLGRYLE